MNSVFSARLVAAGAALALALAAGPAVAQSGKRKAAAKAPAQITITNLRSQAMTSLVIQTASDTPAVVANVGKPLAAGKSLKLALRKPKGCAYNVLARFADESEAEAEAMDLCKERVIRLTE